MNLAVYLPFLASAVIGQAGGYAARRVSPAAGAVVLAALGLVAAAGYAWALLLLAATLIDDTDPAVVSVAPVPDLVAGFAVAGLAVALIRVVVVVVRRHRGRARLSAVVTAAPRGTTDDVVVLADPRPDAFAVPGRWRRGLGRPAARVYVTEGMLRALDAGQRRALFAHERAHLEAPHHLLIAVTDLAAAVNPLLSPVRRAVAFLCERWADERAAAEVGDRGLVASAVGAAALAGAGRGGLRGALAFDRLGVVGRVTALRSPAPDHLRLVAVIAVAVALGIVAADAHATDEFLRLLRFVTTG